jgi:hypothetical protein
MADIEFNRNLSKYYKICPKCAFTSVRKVVFQVNRTNQILIKATQVMSAQVYSIELHRSFSLHNKTGKGVLCWTVHIITKDAL